MMKVGLCVRVCVCVCVCVCVSCGALYGSKQSNEACVRARAVGPHTHSLPQIITLALFLDLSSHSFLLS